MLDQTSGNAADLAPSLQGTRVVVVEDEAILSLALQDMLVELGCVVVGAAARLGAALEMTRTADFDVALLDVNLDGQRVDDVAKAIAMRGTPMVFVTGYGHAGVPGLPGLVIEKPCDMAHLERTLKQALSTSRG